MNSTLSFQVAGYVEREDRMQPIIRRVAGLVCGFALVVSGCTDDRYAGDDTSDAVSEATAEDQVGLTLADFEQYLEDADRVPLAESDAAAPARLPERAGGATGYSRYVFREYQGQVLTSLVEGPLGRQTRCQQVDLPCSYQELSALLAGGEPVPRELGLSRDELTDLVGELDQVRAVVERYADVNRACADGFFSDRTQTPNMGSHFTNLDRVLDGRFDPAEPELLLYAVADAQQPTAEALGQCVDGQWTGADMEIVATAFILLNDQVGDDHPDGFTGELDNWHVHYNLCRGEGVDSIVPREVCETNGGQFYDTLGWMMHTWVAPGYDNQLGVFGMWNPTIWPVSDPGAVHRRFTAAAGGDNVVSIENFSFGPVEVDVGDEVVWSNSDSVAHTVTAGSAASPDDSFDSGVFAPGTAFEVTFDEPGSYSYFCVLHPDMSGTVTVR